jgi:hypothetical protein
VLVAGRFLKRDGELVDVDLDHAIELAENSRDHVLGAVSAGGAPLLPAAPEGFADLISTMTAQHLARAWAIEVAG